MKRKILSSILLITAIVMAVGCGKSNYPQVPDTGNISIHPNAIPYSVASNYFVRNDVESSSVIGQRLDTRTEFNRYFGTAATMSGQPTSIDFNNQFVIAVVAPATDRLTTLKIENLTLHNGILTLSYSKEVGEKRSFSTRPALIVVVDRQYNGEVLVVEK